MRCEVRGFHDTFPLRGFPQSSGKGHCSYHWSWVSKVELVIRSRITHPPGRQTRQRSLAWCRGHVFDVQSFGGVELYLKAVGLSAMLSETRSQLKMTLQDLPLMYSPNPSSFLNIRDSHYWSLKENIIHPF
jgi:hypothetical protein